MLKPTLRKKLFVFIFIITALIIITLIHYHNISQLTKPFENLTVIEVKSISLYSKNVTQEIIYTFTNEECEKIVKLLNGIEIGDEDKRGSPDGGFNPQFRIEKTNGTIINFGTNGSVWIDGYYYTVPEKNSSWIELRSIHEEYYKKYYVPYLEQSN